MTIYYINVNVSFLVPMKDISDSKCNHHKGIVGFISKCNHHKSIVGFMQEFGCTSASCQAAKEMIERHVYAEFPEEKIGTIAYDWIGVIPGEEIGTEIYGDEEIKAGLLADPTKEGIWYHTGHAFCYD